MNSEEVFNHIFESFNQRGIDYVILHSYQELPQKIDSDIDTAIRTNDIFEAITTLDNVLKDTDWRIIQYWQHENYAADCVISNDKEYLQVDFCIHYERNGRVVMDIDELLRDKRKYNNFYIPNPSCEFTYILLKKILKKVFSERSKIQLRNLLLELNEKEISDLKNRMEKCLKRPTVEHLIDNIINESFDDINLAEVHGELMTVTSDFFADLHYKVFDIKRKINRILHPTGLFIVLMGVDGAGKTTIATRLMDDYKGAFRRVKHYHSRVRVLKDISQLKKDAKPIDPSNPHSKTKQPNKLVSFLKFLYYYADYLIGNIIIATDTIKSSLVLMERYYYDYSIDKVRYNLNISDAVLRLFGKLIKKPDVVFVLTGDTDVLYERKKEITRSDIEAQKDKFCKLFQDNKRVVYIDTTKNSVEDCISQMMHVCNRIMRERRKW